MDYRNQSKIINYLEQYAKDSMKKWQVPGMAIAVVKGSKLIYAKGLGVKKLGSTIRVNTRTIFQAGSVTKTFTATLISMLVDDGLLNWTDKVIHHLPNFRLNDSYATRHFTIEDLMSQRSGLPPHSGHFLPYLGYSRKYIIDNLRFIKPASCFRTEYAYQNNLFLVAAAITEKLTGKSWEKVLYNRIIKPLQMTSTTVSLQGYRNSNNSARGHHYTEDTPNSPVTVITANKPYHNWVYTIAPAAGINSNILDLANWLIFNLNKGTFKGKMLLSKKNIDFIHSPKIRADLNSLGEPTYYCEGWLKTQHTGSAVLWHNGGTSGMKSIVAINSKQGIGITILCNLYNTMLPEAITRYFFDLWSGVKPRDWSCEFLKQAEARSLNLQDPPGPRNPSRPLKYYAGVYHNDLYGSITVIKSGSSLKLLAGPKNIELNLVHWGGDTFVLYWPEVIKTGAGIQFYANRHGLVDRIEIQGMNDDLNGFFKKIKKVP